MTTDHYVGRETFSAGLDLDAEPKGHTVEDEIDGHKLAFGIEKVAA